MSVETKIFWACYHVRKPNATFLHQQIQGRSQEEISKELWTIEDIAKGLFFKVPEQFLPKMILYKGDFKDFLDNRGHFSLFVISQRARDAFDGELDKYGLFYPISIPEAPCPYYIFAVNREVEALDLASISLKDPRYQPGVPYLMINKDLLEFQENKIKDLLLFKDSQQTICSKYVYLSQRFVDTVKQHKLTGLHKETWTPIWPRKK